MKYMVEERKLHFLDAEELTSITCREEDCRRRHHEDGRIIVEEIKARFNDSTSTSFSSTRVEFMTRVSVLFSVEIILAPLTCIICAVALALDNTIAASNCLRVGNYLYCNSSRNRGTRSKPYCERPAIDKDQMYLRRSPFCTDGFR